MSEVLIKNQVFQSKNAVSQKMLHNSIVVLPLDAAPFFREIALTKAYPVKNFDESFRYVRIDSPEPVEVIYDSRSQRVRYFEIMADEPKKITIKYHGETQVVIGFVGGV